MPTAPSAASCHGFRNLHAIVTSEGARAVRKNTFGRACARFEFASWASANISIQPMGMPKADNSQVQRFPTTQWSVVLAAQGANTSDSRQAFARLCETCWYPVYAFIRSRTRQRADAEDLTQDFFTSLLAYGSIDSAKPERGRFRAFLLGSAKHYLSGEQARASAQKRGGRQAAGVSGLHRR